MIAVDRNPERIKLARKNAAIYGVSRRIDFRVGDSFKMLAGIKADAVITCPPWASRFHANDVGDEKQCGMAGVLKMAHKLAPRVVLHLPKTIDRTRCLRVSRNAEFGRVEFEDVIVDGRTDSINMYLKSRQVRCIIYVNTVIILNLLNNWHGNFATAVMNGLGYFYILILLCDIIMFSE